MGHPYIASLWLGSLWGYLCLKRLEHCLPGFVLSVARLALISVNKGFHCYLRTCTHFCVWRGSMLYKAFVLYFMDPIQIITNKSNSGEGCELRLSRKKKIFAKFCSKFLYLYTSICDNQIAPSNNTSSKNIFQIDINRCKTLK